MERVIAAGLFAMVLSIVVGPKFIEFLRRNELGQHIREEGPEGHRIKQGTPVMGGVLIVLAVGAARSSSSASTRCAALTVFAVTHRVRRDRLHRRLHQGQAPPLARPRRPLEAAAARRDHGLPRLGRPGAGARHRRLHSRARRDRPVVGLVRARLLHRRGRGQRREPHGRPRRARRRDRDHRAASPTRRST